MADFPSPGRGAWTLTGGLLPASARSKSRGGYYRAPQPGELAPGEAYLAGKDTSHHAYVVHLGVRAIQQLLGVTDDGWFGSKTGKAALNRQQILGLEADGIVGRSTMRSLLAPLVAEIATHNGVPGFILGGLLVNESALDPAAVGINGLDHGLAQINLGAHKDTTVEEALDPDHALLFTVEDLAHIHGVYEDRTKNGVDAWDIAIANHNSPKLARQWATTGSAPVVAGRAFQIEDYVRRVRAGWINK